MNAYLTRHAQVFVRTLGDFARSPAVSLLTIVLVGVTLALPAGLAIGLLNAQRLSGGWQPRGSLSVYLKKDLNGREVLATIGRTPGVANTRYISPRVGLREFAAASGLVGVRSVLHHNPLPAVVIVTPRASDAATIAALAARLRTTPGVAHVQSNLAWVTRFDAVMALGHRLVVILALMLGLALVLILANTTRAAVASRVAEISVVRLVGGTNAFIRRPFLYAGAMIGALGALLALVLVELAIAALDAPVDALDAAYGAHYRLMGPALGQAFGLLALGAGLGWLGARIAVGRALRADRP